MMNPTGLTLPALSLFALALASCAAFPAGPEASQGSGAASRELEAPPPVPGLSEASEAVYAALMRGSPPEGMAPPGSLAREPALLRPYSMDYGWEGEAARALEAAALSIGWKVRCPAGLGLSRVRVSPGGSGRVLDLLAEIGLALAAAGEALKVDVFTETFTVERSGE
ncbi:MAG: hypothetical protein LBW85_12560 [Deltaproteobacteria bacterium]|jgi:hypothetical protein|nr:hypothetical protein [Deltaproteobacteria bacterium]